MQEENKVKKSFFQNVKAELKKVIWPTGKQVVKNTFATIVFVLLITLILGVFNLVFDLLKGEWFNVLFPEEKVTENAQVIGSEENSVLVSGETEAEAEEQPQEQTDATEDLEQENTEVENVENVEGSTVTE